MPFNPLLPVDGSLIVASELRSQFTGLDAKISDVATLNQLNEATSALDQEIQTAVANSSANTNAVDLITITSGDFAVQTLIEKVNELILAQRR